MIKIEESRLSKILKTSHVTTIKLFQVNDIFFQLSEGKQWIIDGGIEFEFSNGSHLSIGWNNDKEMFVFEEKLFDKLISNIEYVELSNNDINRLKLLENQSIIKVDYIWKEFDVYTDYTMNTTKEPYLVGIHMIFKSNDFLNISLIDYEIEENKPRNYVYDVASHLLISYNTTPILET